MPTATTHPHRRRSAPRAWTQIEQQQELARSVYENERRQAAEDRAEQERRQAQFSPNVRPGGDKARGLVLGRFNPPHLGHQFVLDTAANFCGHVTVIIRPEDERTAAPTYLRQQWVREMCPAADVRAMDGRTPRVDPDHPDYWPKWARLVREQWGRPCAYVFGSDDSARQVAGTLGATYVPVDPERRVVPISGTRLRADLMSHWRYLAPPARPFYAKTVVLVGAEGSGKSTLAERLARHYDTVFVPEAARHVAALDGGRLTPAGIHLAAAAQLATEDALLRQANRVLICDTDLSLLKRWSDRLYGAWPEWTNWPAAQRSDGLYLLLDEQSPNPEPSDPQLAADRRAFARRLRDSLSTYRHVVLTGDWDDRFRAAVDAVDGLIAAAKQ